MNESEILDLRSEIVLLIYRSSTTGRTTDAAFVIRVKCSLVINCYLLAGLNVSQCNKQNVVIEDLHESVWSAGMIDIVRAISTTTAVQAPAIVYPANPECLPMSPSVRLGI